jgi:anthranilate phosphoribosyltransferase
MTDTIRPALSRLARGERPEAAELDSAFAALLAGEATQAQTGAFLMGLEQTGIGTDTLVAGASAMRAVMTRVPFDGPCVDVCGTGGDGSHTLNISTAVSFVLAGCGLSVAKHGNRAMSSTSGAADVLEALGVKLTISPDVEARALRDAGVAFLFAQSHHPAMRHVAGPRRELGFRTVFNLLGPLCNPAGAQRQLVGVFAPWALAVVAEALHALGGERAVVVHGDGGLDEVALSGPTQAVRVMGGATRAAMFTPQDFGLNPAPLSAIRGGDAAFNAAALRALLDGAAGPYRDMVVLNAAVAYGMATDTIDTLACVAAVEDSLNSGRARAALTALIAITNEAFP